MSSQKTDESGKFARDVIWVALAQLFNSIILGLVTMPVLTKTYSPDIYGIWVQINVTLALLGPVLTLQLGQAVVRFLSHEEDKIRRRRTLGSMLSITILVTGLVVILATLTAAQLSVFFFASSEYTLYVRLTFLWLFVNVLFNFFIAYFRARNKMKLLSVRQIAASIITMAAVIVLASNGFDLQWIILAALLIQLIFTLLFFIMVVLEIGFPTPNLTGLRKYLTFSLPQIPGKVMLLLIMFSDRYFITHFLGLSQTGIYSSSHTVANLTNLFYMPIAFVLYPLVAKLWENKRISEVKSYMENSTRVFLVLAIPAAVGIALLSQPLLKFLTTPEFLAGQGLVLLIACGTIFLGVYNLNVTIILLVMKTKILPFIILSSATVSILANIILIPRIGILGAGVSNILAYLVLATIVTIWAKKVINYRLDFIFAGKVIGSTLIMAICLYLLRLNSVWYILLGVIAGTIIFVISLVLMRGFSEQDKNRLTRFFKGLIPGSSPRKTI